jgi:hypothetical protein
LTPRGQPIEPQDRRPLRRTAHVDAVLCAARPPSWLRGSGLVHESARHLRERGVGDELRPALTILVDHGLLREERGGSRPRAKPASRGLAGRLLQTHRVRIPPCAARRSASATCRMNVAPESSARPRTRSRTIRVSVARLRLGAHLGTVRRLLAFAVAGAVAATSVASATSAYCPMMRAQALKHCCCPPARSEAPRLTCCTSSDEVSPSAASAREQRERVQLAPVLVAVAFSHPSGEPSVPVIAPARELLASAAGPPPVPLRI